MHLWYEYSYILDCIAKRLEAFIIENERRLRKLGPPAARDPDDDKKRLKKRVSAGHTFVK